MNVRNMLLTCALVLGLGACCVTISHTQVRHPNLVAAIDLINRASARVSAAQQANDWDMGGHAARAQALLGQARQELQFAIHAANTH